MKTANYIKKGIVFSMIFITIGILAGITGLVFEFKKDLMTGLTMGFLPTGIGMLILYKYSKKQPQMIKNIELENEERNIFINTKAGYTAFWVCYWYIFIAVILYNVINISLLKFLLVTLCFMPIVYFTLVIIFHKKY